MWGLLDTNNSNGCEKRMDLWKYTYVGLYHKKKNKKFPNFFSGIQMDRRGAILNQLRCFVLVTNYACCKIYRLVITFFFVFCFSCIDNMHFIAMNVAKMRKRMKTKYNYWTIKCHGNRKRLSRTNVFIDDFKTGRNSQIKLWIFFVLQFKKKKWNWFCCCSHFGNCFWFVFFFFFCLQRRRYVDNIYSELNHKISAERMKCSFFFCFFLTLESLDEEIEMHFHVINEFYCSHSSLFSFPIKHNDLMHLLRWN